MATELPKAYDPKAAQEKWLSFWEERGYFHSDPDPKRKAYTIVIPPPNVTGALHMGHALNNTLQDVLIRWKRMQGFNAMWMPGIDHAGIATQAVVERRMLEHDAVHVTPAFEEVAVTATARVRAPERESKPEEILSVPADFFTPMKLEEAITHQRINGFMAVLAHMKQAAVKLLDKKATGNEILTEIQALVVAAKAGDRLVVQYSAHGSFVPDDDSDEPDGTDECLCPYDVSSKGPLTDDELFDLFSQRESGVRLLMISDSCHSGTVARFAPIATPPTVRGRGAPQRKVRFLPPAAFLPKRALSRLGVRRARIDRLDGQIVVGLRAQPLERRAFQHFVDEREPVFAACGRKLGGEGKVGHCFVYWFCMACGLWLHRHTPAHSRGSGNPERPATWPAAPGSPFSRGRADCVNSIELLLFMHAPFRLVAQSCAE